MYMESPTPKSHYYCTQQPAAGNKSTTNLIEVPAAYYNFTATNCSNIAIYILIDGTVNVVIVLIAVTLTVTVVDLVI